MFDKILIANRGEIACRVIRTARRLGVGTAAIFSEADASAMHVAMADEAYPVGPPPARDSYLAIERIIETARRAGAQAIHPGYGFLSENDRFAEACAAAGIVFIGPPVEAIRVMGSKSASKQAMQAAGVPLIPGYHGDDQDPATLKLQAESIGYPLLIKASAGGGGKGMRAVDSSEGFDAALESAKREAASAFADDKVLIERFLQRARHVEVQVFADCIGNVIHLFERDCSIQRRHQKVVEEAPAPGLDDAARAAFGKVAVDAASAIGYVGAGTVEFIMDASGAGAGAFFFMEMNTRLQVEHPVTEMITGQDLVEWQLRVAAGEPLPLTQGDLSIDGHAFEARIYAEDPDRGFLPATGRLRHLAIPAASEHVRVDAAVRAGDAISVHYDPMIAKLIVWDRDRRAALRRLRAALAGCATVGVTTNLPFLSRIAAEPDFNAGPVTTGYIGERETVLLPGPEPLLAEEAAFAIMRLLDDEARALREAAWDSADAWSPWQRLSGWRLNDVSARTFPFLSGGDRIEIAVDFERDGLRMSVPGLCDRMPIALTDRIDDHSIASIGERRLQATVVRDGADFHVIQPGRVRLLHLSDALAVQGLADEHDGAMTAPMPGRLIAVHVKPGDAVTAGTVLLVMEAMKMAHMIAAPFDGVVASIHYAEGELVEEGAELLSLDADRQPQVGTR